MSNYSVRLTIPTALAGLRLDQALSRLMPEESRSRLVRLIEEGISAGEFRRVDARNAAVTVVAIMVHYFSAAPVLRQVLGHDPLRPGEVAKRREAVHDFLEHGLFLSRAKS